jgi:DNA-directed RNA polymerase subunit RPC12/RpoP
MKAFQNLTVTVPIGTTWSASMDEYYDRCHGIWCSDCYNNQKVCDKHREEKSMSSTPQRGKWVTELRCWSCDHIVSCSVKMRGDGRCPYCGYKAEEAVTIMKTRSVGLYKPYSNVRIVWTFFKLKVVRVLLAPLLKLHIWLELRGRGQ